MLLQEMQKAAISHMKNFIIKSSGYFESEINIAGKAGRTVVKVTVVERFTDFQVLSGIFRKY